MLIGKKLAEIKKKKGIVKKKNSLRTSVKKRNEALEKSGCSCSRRKGGKFMKLKYG